MAVRTSRLSMASVSHIGGFRQVGAGASVPIFGQSETDGFLRPPASIECRCATFSATVSAAPPQADPSAVSVLRRNTFSVCLSPASRGRQRFRFSSWRTHIRFGVDRQAAPALPCRAPPSHALPRLPCLDRPRHASPCRAVPRLPCPAVPGHASPRPAVPALPFRDQPGRAVPGLAMPALPCLAGPCLARPRPASPGLACPAPPCRACPCRACLAYAVRRAFRIAANTLASSLSVAYFLSNARNSARASTSICARISLSVNTDTVAR